MKPKAPENHISEMLGESLKLANDIYRLQAASEAGDIVYTGFLLKNVRSLLRSLSQKEQEFVDQISKRAAPEPREPPV